MSDIIPYRSEPDKDFVTVNVSELALLKASRLLKEKDDENYNFPFRGIRYVPSKKRAYWLHLLNQIKSHSKYEDVAEKIISSVPIAVINGKYFSINNVYYNTEKENPKKLHLIINEDKYHNFCNYGCEETKLQNKSLCGIKLTDLLVTKYQSSILDHLGIKNSTSKIINFFYARKLTKFLEIIIKKLDAKIINFIRLKEE